MFWFFYIFLWVGSYYVYDVGNSRKTMENIDQNYCDDCDVGDIGCSWFSKESWTSFWLRGQRRLGGRCCGRLEQVPWIKIIVDRIGRIYVALYFSPTAITLGSSAIVKVLGRDRFRTLYGSLGQIRLGLPQGSVEGSPGFQQGFTKVSPRFHQGSSSFVVSLVFWGGSVLGLQKVPRYHVLPINLHSAESDPSCRCFAWAYFVW